MKTGTACVRAILDAFHSSIGGRPFTMNEAAEWAEREGLYPTPKRGDPPAAFDDFLKRLDAVLKKISRSWFCHNCKIEVYSVRCRVCGKSKREKA